MKLYDNLLGHSQTNNITMFSGSDSLASYNKNLELMPDDWYYRNNFITYKFNAHGHRCKDIKDLDFKNYILFIGDSYTGGIGIEYEKTYPYVISKSLSVDFYNLGLGGTGIDTMFYNLNVWLSQYPKPKYINIFWSDPNRFISKENETFLTSTAQSKNTVSQRMFKYGELSNYFKTRCELYYNMINLRMLHESIPCSNITVFSYYDNTFKNLKAFGTFTDRARDLVHPGHSFHEQVSDFVTQDFADKYHDARDNHTS